MLRLPRSFVSKRMVSAAILATSALCAQSRTADPRIDAIRFWSFGDVTRVAVEVKGEYHLSADRLETPPRLVFDLRGLRPPASHKRGTQIFSVGDLLIKQIRVAETEPGVSRLVFDLEVPCNFTSSQLVDPDRLMIEVRPKNAGTAPNVTARTRTGARRPANATINARDTVRLLPDLPLPEIERSYLFANLTFPRELPEEGPLPKSKLVWKDGPRTTPNASFSQAINRAASTPEVSGEPYSPARIDPNSRSLVRVFGLKIHKVVIDAGHGGHDTGTIGPKSLMEKDLVLDVALRLGKLVEQRLGAEVVYTRATDVFIPLEQRTKIANDQKADLFISIHANSSPASSATGVETYYFNFTSDQNAINLATRENASSASSIFQLNDLLHKAVLNAKVEESREFAQRVQTSLYGMSVRMNKASRDRGVKKAPFVVLIGATMPSILAEVGFVSNPRDEKLLKREDQRQKIAESLYKGLSAYASSLSHEQIARIKTGN